MFLHTWHPHPDILTLGSFHLRWYGLCLAIGVLAAMWMMQRLARQYQLNVERMFDASLIVLVSGFVGARLYHVSNEWAYYRLHPTDIWKVWNGGLAMHGALIAGLLALLFVARRWKWNVWLMADIAAPAVAIGQTIGRWGNYFNQELFGRPTGLPWGIPIDQLNRPPQYFNQTYFHPTFLYESLGSAVIAIALWWLHRRRARRTSGDSGQQRPGAIALLYFICYGSLRLATESLRIDQTPIIGGVRLPILISGLIVIVAGVLLALRSQRPHARS